MGAFESMSPDLVNTIAQFLHTRNSSLSELLTMPFKYNRPVNLLYFGFLNYLNYTPISSKLHKLYRYVIINKLK